jgi:hypothetical protein
MSRDFSLYTLVDITETGMLHNEGTERDQQRNYQTVVQTIGIYTQPVSVQQSTQECDLSSLNFGADYKGIHRVWLMRFSIDYNGIFENQKGRTGILVDAFNEVPIIVGLLETARFILPCFFATGPLKNIYFKEG